MIYSPHGLMRYNDSIAIVDDMPLLSQWIKKHSFNRTSVFLVPEAGLEPAPCRQDWILSPARLPIPSFRRTNFLYYTLCIQKNQ